MPNPEVPSEDIPRREAVRRLVSFPLGASLSPLLSSLTDAAEGEEKQVPVEIVDVGEGRVPISVYTFALDEKLRAKALDQAAPKLETGRQKLYARSADASKLVEVSYEVLDRGGTVRWQSGKTHVPCVLDLAAGEKLRIRRFPAIPLLAKDQLPTLKSTRERAPSKEGARCPLALRRTRKEEPHFGVNVLFKNIDSKQEVEASDEAEARKPLEEGIPPGRYEVLIRHSRQGFPQFGIVRVIGKDEKVLEEYPPTYQNQYNPTITLNEEERVTVDVLPAVRPYNSMFFEAGEGERRAQAALMIPRPYPSQDFQGWKGREKFNALPLCIVDSGRTVAREKPDELQNVKKVAISGYESSFLKEHPEWALGCLEVARRLAADVVAKREEHPEDIRGVDHLSFLVRRTADGKFPPVFMDMKEEELRELIFRKLVEMYEHNVHRVNEGGGYNNTTFTQDLEEAEKLLGK